MSIDHGLIRRGLESLGIQPPPGGIELLTGYLREIELWNPTYGLVNASGDELTIKHLFDSLAALGEIRAMPHAAIADIGSGAGLPGIPLSVFLTDSKVDLVERSEKRCRFLENVIASLALKNVSVIESEVAHLTGSYDLVVFRAFRPFERRLFASIFRLCSPTGALLAYKGKKDRAMDELNAIEGLYSNARLVSLSVPFLDEERCALVLKPAGTGK